jgi:tetratricopeptide (TPR) repeat protein
MSKYNHISKIDQLITWGRYKDAIREAEAMLQAYPEDEDAYAMLSSAYLHVDEKKALYWSQEALSRDPQHEDAWRTRLFTYRSQDNDNQFKETLDEILRLFPHKSYPYFYLAEWHIKRVKFSEARAALEQAIQIGRAHV